MEYGGRVASCNLGGWADSVPDRWYEVRDRWPLGRHSVGRTPTLHLCHGGSWEWLEGFGAMMNLFVKPSLFCYDSPLGLPRYTEYS